MVESIKKLYNLWNVKKQIINNNPKIIHVKERDILFINMGKNIGVEQDGKGNEFLRPVVVYKKFNSRQFVGIALTSQEKTGRYYFPFQYLEDKKSYAILSQVRVFDTKRVKYKSGVINQNDFKELHVRFQAIVTPTECERVPKEYR